jgi:flagellin
VYLNFDSASATIILSLNSLNAQLNQTETELSTGNAINSAADNPVVWAEASRAQADAGGWGAVANEIEGVGSPELTSATSALSTILSTLGDMQTTVEDVVKSGDDDDTTTAAATLAQYGKALTATVTDAVSSNGVNLLDGTAGATVDFVEGYDQTGTVQTYAFTTQALTGGDDSILKDADASGTSMDLTALTAGDLSSANIDDTLENIKGAITDVTSYFASLGGMASSQTTMQDFAQTMQTNLQDGADDLIGADLNALSARETALQTQMQLATQALSISTQSSQLVLKLFE